jgi:hypothetical protein
LAGNQKAETSSQTAPAPAIETIATTIDRLWREPLNYEIENHCTSDASRSDQGCQATLFNAAARKKMQIDRQKILVLLSELPSRSPTV